MWPSVTVSTITLNGKEFLNTVKVFKNQTFWAWIWTQILNFFDKNKESYCRLNMAKRVTRNSDSNYMLIERRKNGSLMFCHEFGLEIFFLYHEINLLKIKFWVKNTLVASYSQALIALKMCWKLIFGRDIGKVFQSQTCEQKVRLPFLRHSIIT